MDNYLHLMGVVHEQQSARRREAAMHAWSLRVANEGSAQRAQRSYGWKLVTWVARWGWLVGKPQRTTRSISLTGYALQMRAGR